MGQTKRKRRNKHRGNAVGAVEARGRTSKPNPEVRKAAGRGARTGAGAARGLRPPTYKSAALKAFVGIVILFIFFRFLGQGTTTTQALVMCGVAFLMYTPLMYVTDKWIYNRKVKQLQGGGARR